MQVGQGLYQNTSTYKMHNAIVGAIINRQLSNV